MCWDGMGRSPTFEFPSKKAITWVQTSRNVDISWNSNGHISVVRDATVTWLGKLLVLHVLCMLMWSWPNPRSRSRGFSTSENCWSRACWRWWPSATLWGFLVLLFIVAHVFCQITTYTVLCMLSDVLMNDCLWRCLETPVCIKLPFKHWGRRCCQHSQKTPAALWQRPAVCQVALSLSSTSTTALMVNLPVPLPWWSRSLQCGSVLYTECQLGYWLKKQCHLTQRKRTDLVDQPVKARWRWCQQACSGETWRVDWVTSVVGLASWWASVICLSN